MLEVTFDDAFEMAYYDTSGAITATDLFDFSVIQRWIHFQGRLEVFDGGDYFSVVSDVSNIFSRCFLGLPEAQAH